MKVREEKLRTIIEWSEKNEDVRVLLLTSSLVNPLALVDEFSDLDIEFVFEDNTNYISDKSWTLKFGNPIAMIEEDESCFNHKHAMKMLLYEDGVKVDFKLYSKSKFIKETQEKELPEDWDIGNKTSSGIPKENRVIDLSPISNERYTSAINSTTSLLSFFTDGCVVAGADKRIGL